MTLRACGLLALLGCGSQPGMAPDASPAAAFAPSGVTPCGSGCSSPVAELEPLGDVAIADLLHELARTPVGAENLAADTLLFHAVESTDYLDRVGSADLPIEHIRWLRQELGRDRVEVGLRLVAADGGVVGSRDDTVDLAQKQHLLLQGMGDLGRADVNGKVKRVGVRHLWARF